MAHSLTLNVTLSEEAVQFVRDKMSSGSFVSESEVISKSLETLKHEAEDLNRWEQEMLRPVAEAEIERWIQEVGGPRHDSFQANPSNYLSAEEVVKNLEERRQQRAKTRS